jgi:riboflavin kinase/FMN adenylyltransferase
MYLIRGQNNIKLFKKRFPEISLSATIGNFDGMHLGHKAILEKVKKNAKEKNLSTLVIFTEPHAAEYFSKINNTSPPPRIIPWRDKLRLISENGLDFCMLLRFDESLKSMTPKQFTEKILEELQIKSLTIGDDFKFGKDRKGDYQFLKNWGDSFGIEIHKTDTIKVDDQRVSSTRIREALISNNFETANAMLDWHYSYSGKVVYGNQLGREIGVPTANIWIPRQKLPISGVYAVRCIVDNAKYLGIANMGIRPTVEARGLYSKHIFLI